jgi:hypothetical protein
MRQNDHFNIQTNNIQVFSFLFIQCAMLILRYGLNYNLPWYVTWFPLLFVAITLLIVVLFIIGVLVFFR